MKRFLLLATALLCPAVATFAQNASLAASSANYSASGGTVTLTAGIDYTGAATPTALGYHITLPAGWKIADDGNGTALVGGTNPPNTSPPADTGPNLDFAYSSFPSNKVSFVVVVKYPAGLTGTQTISASAIYRTPLVEPTIASISLTSAADAAPVITTNPASQTVNAGQSVTFSAVATGNPAPTFQWQKSGVDIPNAIGPAYTITNVTSSSAGSYSVVATNAFSSAPSSAATLTVRFVSGFAPLSGTQGTTVTITGSGFTNATNVQFGGVNATSFTVNSNTQIAAVVPTFAVNGQIRVTLADATTVLSSGSFTVTQGPRLVSLSQRTNSATGEAAALQTFSVRGAVKQQVLVRAVGPGLTAFGVSGVMADPFLSIYNGTGAQIATNNDWDSALASAFNTVGAFALTTGSKDAALLLNLDPGTYTARVTGVGGTSGVVILEVYEYPTSGSTDRIEYLSSRGSVAAGTAVASGFFIGGTGTSGQTTVLVRAVGGGLGIPGAVANPSLSVLSGSTVIATCDDHTSTNVSQSDLALATLAAGAMPLGPNDSALLLTLPGGAYTANVSGVSGSSGVVLTEIYIIDNFVPAAFAPDLIAPLQPKAANLGDTVSFAAQFIAKPAPTLQWQKTGADISGKTTSVLTLSNVTSADTAAYGVVMQNASGTNPTAAAQLDVNKAAQTITFPAITAKTFGATTTFTLNATSSSGLPVVYSTSNPSTGTVATVSGNTVTVVNAGNITITASQPGNSDYLAATDIPQTLTVNKANPTLSWSTPASISYGTALSSTQLSASASVAGTFVYSPAVGVILNANATPQTLSVTFTPTDTTNYNLATGAVGIVVTRATPILSWSAPAAITYGTALSSTQLNATATGIAGALAGTFAYTPAAGQVLNAGINQALSVTFTPTDAANYTNAGSSTTITVNKATPVITWPALGAISYGTALSATQLNATANTAGTFVYTPAAGMVLNVGASQTLSASFTPADSNNFTTANATNSITVNKATAVVSWSAPAAITYGTALSSTQLNATANTAGTFVYTPAAGTVLNAGAGQTLSVAFTPADTANFNSATASTTITVNKATPSVSWTAPAAITYGDPLSSTQLNATASVAGTFVYSPAAGAVLNAGAQTLSVTFTPTDTTNYNNATGSTSITVNKATPTVSWTAPVAITYGTLLSGTQLNATASVAGTFVYSPAAGAKLNASASAQTLSVNFTPTDAANYNNATGSTTILVNKANQVITFAAIPSKPLDSGNFTLGATTDSGLPLSFATSSPSSGTVATISGSTVTLVNTGTITITASQAGDSNYNAATPASQVLTVLNQSQTVTFAATEVPAKTFGNPAFTINATSNRGLSVSFTSNNTAVATVGSSTLAAGVSSATITIVGAGTANITASQPGDANTAAAPDIVRTLTVSKAAATITLGALSATYDGTPKSATATTNPLGLGVAITYTPAGGSATTTPPINAGSYTVNATITGATPPESNYTGTATNTLVIAKAAQTIAFALTSPVLINSSPITLGATASSNLAISYASSNPTVASVSGNTLTIKALGAATITASQAGDPNYNAATDVARTLAVNPIAPVIASTPPLNQIAIVGSNFVFGPITIASQLAAPYTFSATGMPAGLTVNASNGNISGIPTSSPNDYTIVLTVSNATGLDTRSINLTLRPAAPVFTSAASVSGTAGSAFSYTAVAANAASYSISGSLPTGLVFNNTTGVISGTATGAGTTTVNITATNITGSVTLPLVITLVAPANAPVYSGPTNPSGTAGVAFSFIPNFGAGSGTITYQLAGGSGILPTGLAFDSTTGAITGTPTLPGVTAVTMSATRAGVTASVVLTLTVNPAASAPVISFPAPGNVRSATAGSAMTSIQLTATPPATSFSSVDPLPAGITLTSAGLIAGTPSTLGTSSIALKATNSAGTGPTAVLVLTVNPNPSAPLITSAALVNGRVGVALTYSLTATPVVTTTWSMTGTLPSGLNFDTSTGIVSGTPTAVITGNPTVFFTGTNANGQGNALDVTFTIAPPLTVPVITSASSVSGQVGQPFNYVIAATNSPTSFAVASSTLPTGLLLNASTGVISGVPAAATVAGTPSTVSLTATNSSGTSELKTLAITIIPAPATPVITSAATAAGRVGDAFVYTITASDSPTSFVATGVPPGLNVNPATGAITGTPITAGSFPVTLRAANAAGIGADSGLVMTIAAAAIAPAITSAATATGQVGNAFNYQIVASPAPITSYAISPLIPASTGLVFNSVTGAISGVPTQAFTATFGLTATNAGGTSLPQPLTITIAPGAGVPVITSAGTATGTVGSNFAYTIAATNAPLTSLDAVNLPNGLGVNPYTGVISGIPLSAGTTVASMVATNAAGTGPTRDLTITVQPPAAAPVVTSGAATSAQVGVGFSYQITATNTPTSFEVIGAPPWMTVNPATGAAAGTPTTPGVITLQVVASNSVGTSNPQPVAVTIFGASGTPMITSSQTANGTVGSAFSYPIGASPAATSFKVTGLPAGLSANAATGLISGTPSASGIFNVTVAANNGSGIGFPATIVLTIAPSATLVPPGS